MQPAHQPTGVFHRPRREFDLGVAIGLAVLTFNLFGDLLRAALDPKLKTV